jgi:hypothetical protein
MHRLCRAGLFGNLSTLGRIQGTMALISRELLFYDKTMRGTSKLYKETPTGR